MLQITRNGIVQRREDGAVIIQRPGKNGGLGAQIEVETALADTFRLATGDVVEGVTAPILYTQNPTVVSDECAEDAVDWEGQRDEPGSINGASVPLWLETRITPTERLVSIDRINGLTLEEAEERPFPRSKRSAAERGTPDKLISLSTGQHDTTGSILDFAAPLGAGCAGIIYGPHASGLTRTLRSVVAGSHTNAPDIITIVLLLRARGEEMTDWRRRFPNAEVVVCPSAQDRASAEQILQMADLVLECVQRQTELGRHVLLAVDSLTGLWGAMLEAEEADAQSHADQALARQRIREWLQKAGAFNGEGLLGSGLGGSLTIIGTVWQQEIDPEAEEERDIHPHLRLLEHILHETSWRVPISAALAHQRLYPAIDTGRCHSRFEESLLPASTFERISLARRALAGLAATERYPLLMDALETSSDMDDFLERLAARKT